MSFRTSIKNIMLKKFFNGFLAFFATSTVAAQTEPLKVLFIGNSYTHMNQMPKMFDKIAKSAGMNVIVEKCAQSSATFKIHAEERPEVYEAIESRKWDYVILQGFSREMAFEPKHLDSTIIPYADKITKAIYDNNSCTNVMFYMTWGYKHGYNHREETDSYEKMTAKIESGYSYIAHHYDVPVVPVGLVWKNLRENNKEINLYHKDLAHPNKNGSYLIASTFHKAIFGTKDLNHNRIIRKKFAEEIQYAADRVLSSETRVKYKLDRYFIELDTYAIEDELGNISYKLTYNVNPTNVKSVVVRLDDNKTKEGTSGSHLFLEEDLYAVRFDVTNNCDEVSTHIRQVDFNGIVPRRRKEDEME